MAPQAGKPSTSQAAWVRVRTVIAGRALHGALLTLIILVAFALRALRCSEGLPYLHQWDEPQTASTALTMMKTGDYNPRFFHYGSLMIYLNLGVDVAHYLYLMTRPETDPWGLISLDHIETKQESGYHWTISHPSFYLWNRLLTAVLGTGSILIAYFIARELSGRWAGMLAAALLAGVEYDIANSALVTPNVPAAFFGTLAVLLALIYARQGSAAHLVGSAATCGLAASTKYNAAICIVTPALVLVEAWWRDRRRPSGWLWTAIVLAAVAAFLAGTPYAVLDLPHFLKDLGYELRHYKVLGHDAETIEPGMTHALYQLRMLTGQIGSLTAAFALLGVGASLVATPGRIVFAFPIVYLLYMSGTKVAFHRNFLILYPFTGVAFGCGVVAAARLLGAIRSGSVPLRSVRAAVLIIGAALCVGGITRALPVSWRVATTRETRSVAIDKINELAARSGSKPRVGIARELGIHPVDLARLKAPSEVVSFFDLMCADRSKYDLLVTAREARGDGPADLATGDLMNDVARSWASDATSVIGLRWLHLSNLNLNPGILILPRAATPGEAPVCSSPLDLRWEDPDGETTLRTGREVELSGAAATAGTDWMAAPPGAHAFVWFASGRSRSGIAAALRCTLRLRFGGIVADRERKDFDLSRAEIPYVLTFEAPGNAELSVVFEKIRGGAVTVRSVRSVELPHGAATSGAPGAGGGP